MSASTSLPDRITARFTQAQESGAVHFLDTEVCIVHLDSNGRLPFQLRYAPGLAKKPTPNDECDDDKVDKVKQAKEKVNPFANPDPELVIGPVGPSHTLVLNKYPIIPSHSILITNSNLPQTSPLRAVDLDAVYQLLRDHFKQGHKLFGFFNSGADSGASQPHRHIQFLPVEGMRSGLPWSVPAAEDEGVWWENLAWRLGEDEVRDALPFVTFTARLKGSESGVELENAYRALLETASEIHRSYFSPDPDAEGLHSSQDPYFSADLPSNLPHGPTSNRDGLVGFSYNLAFTTRSLSILPRTSEAGYFKLDDRVVKVQLNGTVLGGTLLVKERDVYEALNRDHLLLAGVLGQIGVPKSALLPGVMGWKGGLVG